MWRWSLHSPHPTQILDAKSLSYKYEYKSLTNALVIAQYIVH